MEKEEFLFKFPILDYVEEISKIFILNELELLFWCWILEHYLNKISSVESAVDNITGEKVRLLFFCAAMFVKKFRIYGFSVKQD